MRPSLHLPPNPTPSPSPTPTPSPGQVTFLLPSESLIIEDCKKIAGAKVGLGLGSGLGLG